MRCKQCGTYFEEGIFCPECGTKMEAEDTTEFVYDESEKSKEEHEKPKREKQSVEEEKGEDGEAQRREEKNRLEEAERLIRENPMRDLENRTVRGTVYKTVEEANAAKAEHDQIDILKEKLMLIKSQKRRREVFNEFKNELKFMDAKKRYELLKVKVETPTPLSEKALNIYGITVLSSILIFIYIVLAFNETVTGILERIEIICFAWGGIGIWIWIIWKIVLMVRQRKSSYYRNIKDI